MGGGPDLTLSLFNNDTSTIAAGVARFTIRHTASVSNLESGEESPLDFIVDGAPVFTNIAFRLEGVADLPAGTVEVLLRESDAQRIGLFDVRLGEGVNTIIYVVGALEPETGVTQLVQTITGLHEAPDRVESGLGGMKADEQRAGRTRRAALAGLVLLAGVGLRRCARWQASDSEVVGMPVADDEWRDGSNVGPPRGSGVA